MAIARPQEQPLLLPELLRTLSEMMRRTHVVSTKCDVTGRYASSFPLRVLVLSFMHCAQELETVPGDIHGSKALGCDTKDYELCAAVATTCVRVPETHGETF
jgi:hypothetical protein